MHESYEKTTLENLLDGSVGKKFKTELKRVIANLLDENTSPVKKREITIKLSLRSDKDTREMIFISDEVYSKIAPPESKTGICVIAEQDGEVSLFQEKERQIPLFKEKSNPLETGFKINGNALKEAINQ